MKAIEEAWREFNKNFQSEKDCVEKLWSKLAESNQICKHCKSGALINQPGERALHCSRCPRKSWFTAGTYFHRIRKLRPWLAAIWFLEKGIIINSNEFSKLLEVSYDTAFRIFKKLSTALKNKGNIAGELIDSSYFLSLFSKRSTRTPALEHPSSEEKAYCQTVEKSAAESRKEQPQEREGDILLAAEKNLILITLNSSPAPIQFDELQELTKLSTGTLSAALILLELDGNISSPSRDSYSISEQTTLQSNESKTQIDQELFHSFLQFVRSTFQGISRKYLQNYLYTFACQIQNSLHKEGTILETCLSQNPINYKEIISYVSPKQVLFPQKY
ncbi:MAG: hypothetical protein K2X27_26340 [Candidatus Obscuribacterales bacterium]|nr:hypothetical protein [Candidatus Obscuribacterales bacterium]